MSKAGRVEVATGTLVAADLVEGAGRGEHVARVHRDAVIRLCRTVLDQPRWHRVLAFLVSAWTFAWIGGQFIAPQGDTALVVLRRFGARVGLEPVPWAARAAQAMQAPEQQHFAYLLALIGGLSWAATTERAQMPALFGWLAVMLAAEGLGYRPAVVTALGALVGFIAVLWLVSLVGGGRLVDRRPALLRRDVLRAGITAAVLSAIVPLIAPGVLIARLCRPYLTWPPRRRAPAETGGRGLGDEVPRPRRPSGPERR